MVSQSQGEAADDLRTEVEPASTNGNGSSYRPEHLARYVRKRFGKKYFFGLVVEWCDPWYKVVYEDGDGEELTANTVRRLLWKKSVPMRSEADCQDHGHALARKECRMKIFEEEGPPTKKQATCSIATDSMEGNSVTPEASTTRIVIVLKDQSMDELHFKLFDSTPFRKVFKTYVERMKVCPFSLKFYYKGKMLYEFQRPMDYNMRHYDTIDVYTVYSLY